MKALNLLLSSKGYPTKDKVANLIGMKMRGGAGWPITTLTGSLPLTYESRTEHILKNYALYGSASGAGVETENLIDVSQIQPAGTYQLGKYTFECDENTAYTFSSSKYMQEVFVYGNADYSSDRIAIAYTVKKISFDTGARSTVYIRFALSKTTDDYRTSDLMLTSGSTAPETYIPYGFKIPLTNSGENSQSETYPLYIGSTKLGEEEYLDYETGKIYKMIDGVLTPTDPPATLPAITAYQGENALSSTETVGECSVTGRIKETET